jgi:hypothetical protein
MYTCTLGTNTLADGNVVCEWDIFSTITALMWTNRKVPCANVRPPGFTLESQLSILVQLVHQDQGPTGLLQASQKQRAHAMRLDDPEAVCDDVANKEKKPGPRRRLDMTRPHPQLRQGVLVRRKWAYSYGACASSLEM